MTANIKALISKSTLSSTWHPCLPLFPYCPAKNKGIRANTGGALPATKGTLEKKGCQLSSPPGPLSRRRGGVVPMVQAVETGTFLPLTPKKSFAPLLPSPSGEGSGVRINGGASKLEIRN